MNKDARASTSRVPTSESAPERGPLVDLLQRPATPWIVLLTAIALTGSSWWASRRNVEQRAEHRFRDEVERAEFLVRQRMLNFERMLNGTEGLFAAAGEVTREGWRDYTTALRLREDYTGVQALGFIRLLTPDEKATFEAEVRAEGFPDFAVTPPGARDEYASVAFIEPFEDRNLRAFGYDLWSEPVRRTALAQARDTGHIALTGKLELAQENGANVQPEILMVVPVYRHGQALDTEEQRRAALTGWTYSAFRMGDLMQGLLGNANPELRFEVFDGEQTTREALLFDSAVELAREALDDAPSRTETRRIEVAGRPWSLRFYAQPNFEAAVASNQPLLIAVGGLALDLLLFGVIWSLARQRRRSEQLAVAMTASYRRANEALARNIAEHELAGSALRESEERMRLIIETEPECVKLLGPDGALLQMNPAGLKMIEADSFRQVDRACVYALVEPAHRDRFQSLTERVFRGESGTLEFELIGLKGTRRWLETHATPLRNEQGEVASLLAITRDITPRKKAEEALRESGERFRLLFEGASDAIFWADPTTGLITHCNRAAETLLGRERAEIIGQSQSFLHPPEEAAHCRKIFELHASSASTESIEVEVLRKDGRRVAVSISPSVTSIGSQQILQGIFRDITERKRIEATLRDSEERFRELAENVHEVLWMTDAEKAHLLYVSPAYEKIWGRSCSDLYRSPHDWLEALHVEDRERVMHAAQTRLSAGDYDETYRIVRPDGTVRWIRDRAFPVRDASGVVLRIVGTAEDVTARRQLEDQLRQAHKLEAIGTLAGGVAHDFNNILAAILGNTQLALIASEQGASTDDYLEEIKRASERAKSLVQQILTFSRRQPQVRLVISLVPVVQEAVALLRATIPSGVEIVTSFEAEVPCVLADATQISQVLVNLGTNAWHALGGQPGRIEIRLEPVTLDAEAAGRLAGLRPGRFACLSVSDTGVGIDEATLPRIFDPFFTTKGPQQGTGLGLSVVHGILHGHDGAISVASRPGHGATFRAYFPAAIAAPGDGGAAATAELVHGAGKHILYLDDEEPLVRLATRTLERLHFRVTGFTRAADAVAAFCANPAEFDLVITDLNLPGASGLGVAARLLAVRPDVPIVLSSGHVTDDLRDKAQRIGIRELLYKPSRIEELCEVVQRLTDSAPAL